LDDSCDAPCALEEKEEEGQKGKEKVILLQ